MSSYHPDQRQPHIGRPGRAPSSPGKSVQQPSSRLEQSSVPPLQHHQRHPSALSMPIKHYRDNSTTLHDSGYDGASDKSCNASDEHLSQDPSLRRPFANPPAQYSNEYLPQRTGPGPPTRFQDIPETFAQNDNSPHSSSSGHSKTSSTSRFHLPTRLRTSSNSSTSIDRSQMDRVTPPRSDYNGTLSPRLRSSDEGSSSLSNTTSNTTSKALKKRSGLSSFFNGVLGSPRSKIEISAPTNPTHLCHVGFNSVTGEFTVSKSVEPESSQVNTASKMRDYNAYLIILGPSSTMAESTSG